MKEILWINLTEETLASILKELYNKGFIFHAIIRFVGCNSLVNWKETHWLNQSNQIIIQIFPSSIKSVDLNARKFWPKISESPNFQDDIIVTLDNMLCFKKQNVVMCRPVFYSNEVCACVCSQCSENKPPLCRI